MATLNNTKLTYLDVANSLVDLCYCFADMITGHQFKIKRVTHRVKIS